MAEVELLVPALAEHVRTARLVVVAVARRAGLADDLVDELRLAVGEACARAVGLHAGHSLQDRVGLVVTDDVTGLTVSVSDSGPPAGPSVDGLSDGGTGFEDAVDDGAEGPVPPDVALAVLRGLVDEIEVSAAAVGPGTVVRMTWPLRPRTTGGTASTVAAGA